MTADLPPTRLDAVIFRTHFWDDFVRRQFERVVARSRDCDVFVLVDETNGPVLGIAHDRVVRVTEQTIVEMGLPRAGTGNMLWFNGDYPLYYLLDLYPTYLQYLQIEYDVAVNIDLGAMLCQMRIDEVDFIALTKGEVPQAWPWRDSCADLYGLAGFSHKLVCLCAFSARALQHLFRKRRQHANLLARGEIAAWPMCEAFIATELAAGGFRSMELSQFGNTDAYDHWPPFLEEELPVLQHHAFIHPVLDRPRYIASMLKYHVGLAGYLDLRSLFHRKLRQLPPALYLRTVIVTFVSKFARVLREAVITSK